MLFCVLISRNKLEEDDARLHRRRQRGKKEVEKKQGGNSQPPSGLGTDTPGLLAPLHPDVAALSTRTLFLRAMSMTGNTNSTADAATTAACVPKTAAAPFLANQSG